MSAYDSIFPALGLSDWCQGAQKKSLPSLSDLTGQVTNSSNSASPGIPFPSLDNLNAACPKIPRSRDATAWLEDGFLGIKDALKVVLDPLTQPLSWILDGALEASLALPWWLMLPVLAALAYGVSRSFRVVFLVLATLSLLAFMDLYDDALKTLAIIFVCAAISMLLGIPIGIAMARSNRLQQVVLPVLDMLQTLPTFVYLIPLIFLFSVTEPKLYGIAIILYAIVPVIRLTDLGIRLVDKDVLEAADAFGMSSRQRLTEVEFPLALPTIMAGINQTIMMSLAMVVIASLVSAPGLGTLVLRGINRLELGVGLVSGLAIVLLAIMLDRTSKAALARIDKTRGEA